MRPRTKEEEIVVEWSNNFPDLTAKQKTYAVKHAFENLTAESRGHLFCSECGHTWRDMEAHDDSVQEVKCPHCGKVHQIVHHKTRVVERAYFELITTKGGMQAIRWFLVTRESTPKGVGTLFDPVAVEWVTPSGKRYNVERGKFTMCYRVDQWLSYGSMELRRYSTFARWINPNARLVVSVLPLLRRNGWTSKHDLSHDAIVMSELLSNPNFESWVKVGHYGLCYEWVSSQRSKVRSMKLTDELKTLVKLANRKHYAFDTREKWNDHYDYVQDLKCLNKDLHNPALVFPEDFQKAHQYWNKKAEKKREEERRAQRTQWEREWQMKQVERDKEKQKWLAEYEKRYSGMLIVSDEFTIKPLITLSDFQAESNTMHHCILTYYGKLRTLLLSIEHNGSKCETAEIRLDGSGDLVQCRGVCNQSTQYHDAIVALLKANMGEFIRRSTCKLIDKPATIVNLPVLASQYKQQFKIA